MVFIFVKSLDINYINIAFLDDLLVIKTSISQLKKQKFSVFNQ